MKAKSWKLNDEQLGYKDEWIQMMEMTNRIKRCKESEPLHVTPHFPVKGKEKSGYNRIVGSFQALNDVTKPMKTDKVDCLELALWHSLFKFRGKIDLSMIK